MLQRNITGYTIVVQPPDGSHREPFELANGEEVDWPDPIPGCAALPPAPAPEPEKPADPAPPTPKKTPSKPAASADGGDPA